MNPNTINYVQRTLPYEKADNWVKNSEIALKKIQDLAEKYNDKELRELGYDFGAKAEIEHAEKELETARLYRRIFIHLRNSFCDLGYDKCPGHNTKIHDRFDSLTEPMTAEQLAQTNADEFAKLVLENA